MSGVDPVLLEIVQGSLAAIELEVETAIGRTARSPMIRDAHDFRAGIHDRRLRKLTGRSYSALVHPVVRDHRIETMRPYCTPEETAFATDLLGNLARVLSEGMLPTLDDVAHETAVPAEHINHILKILAHSSFLECRRALRVRPTVSEVAFSHEQMAQIAYRHRYQWPGQFDRDFKATLLLTPNEFRRLFFARAFVARDRS